MSSMNTEALPAYDEYGGTHAAPPTDVKHPQEGHDQPPATQQTAEETPSAVTRLEADFAWKNLTARITDPGEPSRPIYTVDYRTFKSPHILFKENATDSIVGSGTLHPVSIDANYEVGGEKGKLKALRRFHTEYTHLSRVYSRTEAPEAMQWVSDCAFKTWDFTCKGPDGVPVARFTSNCWALKKVGSIELYGPLGSSKEAREEIMVVGLTLFSCMLLRTTSILSFFGGVFARPGPLDNPEAEKLREGRDVK